MARVLDLGQCDYDHPQIKALIESLGGTVARAHTFDDARKLLKAEKFDLVLVNRITDSDGTEGVKFISEVKGADGKAGPKMMMVSNYPDAQAAAVKAGALPGFGKNALDASETRARLVESLK